MKNWIAAWLLAAAGCTFGGGDGCPPRAEDVYLVCMAGCASREVCPLETECQTQCDDFVPERVRTDCAAEWVAYWTCVDAQPWACVDGVPEAPYDCSAEGQGILACLGWS